MTGRSPIVHLDAGPLGLEQRPDEPDLLGPAGPSEHMTVESDAGSPLPK